MEWFLNQFLPGIEKRMNNPKYPNQAFITRNQCEVCQKYFHSKQCHGDYGWFTVWEFSTDEASYLITFKGRYIFLNKYPVNEDPAHKAMREAERQRIKAEAVERTKRNPERLARKITGLMKQISGWQEEYELDLADGEEEAAKFDLEKIAELKAELALYSN